MFHVKLITLVALSANFWLTSSAQQPNVNSTSSYTPAGPPAQQQQQVQMSAASLQAHLENVRQLGALNAGLVLNAVNQTKYSNVLEALSNVGKAIQQQISAAASPNHVSIMTAPGGRLASGQPPSELANSKKNEYQALEPAADYQLNQLAAAGNRTEQGEVLRQDILKRVGQLQQVVATSMDLLKNSGDLIARRLLEQMSVRLDQAKAKADRIISEPAAANDVALRALATINLGLNNLNNIISNISRRLEAASKDQTGRLQADVNMSSSQRQQLTPLLDSSRIRSNLHQLSQHFQSALNNSQLHQQLAALRQRQQQQVALLQLAPLRQQASGQTIS